MNLISLQTKLRRAGAKYSRAELLLASRDGRIGQMRDSEVFVSRSQFNALVESRIDPRPEWVRKLKYSKAKLEKENA